MRRLKAPYWRWPILPREGWRLLAVVALVLGSASFWGSFSSTPVSAAGGELRIKTMKLSVWPEYDDPRLLVIYEGEFTDGGTFPREVKFRAPKDASVQMVCALDKGDHKCQVYDTVVEGEFKTIVFTLPIPTFYFEYYNAQIDSTTDKTINYQFVNPPYAIDSMDVEIQQPLKATNFTIDPSSTSATQDTQGLKYFNYKYGGVPADKMLNFAVSYTKTDPNPSVEKKSDSTANGEGQSNSLIAIAAVVVFVLVIGAAYFVFRKNLQQPRYSTRNASAARMRQARALPPEASPKPAYRPTAPERRPAGPSSPGSLFCSNCGAKLDASDAFCYNCGLPVPQRSNPAGKRR